MMLTAQLLSLKQTLWQSVTLCEAEDLASFSPQFCKDWIEEEVKGKTPVNDEYPCTEDVMRSARTFSYEVYEGEMIVEKDGEAIFKDFCYTSGYYYTN